MLVSFALGDAKVPNANDFASQWNIGLKLLVWYSGLCACSQSGGTL